MCMCMIPKQSKSKGGVKEEYSRSKAVATSVSRAAPVNTSAACLTRALLRHAVVEEALETPAPGALVEPYTAFI